MKKLFCFFIATLMCTFINAMPIVEWEKDVVKTFNGNKFTEYSFVFNSDSVCGCVKMTDVFDNSIVFETSVPVGNIKRAGWFRRSGLSANIVIKFYNTDWEKVDRVSTSVKLGINRMGIINNKKTHEYLMNNTGYAVIIYESFIERKPMYIIIPCVNNNDM